MPEKILIIDDDAETLRLIGMMLERQGFAIASLNNGLQAMEIAKIEKPDLIVLDVMMPDVDGYEVTRQIRQEPSLLDVPILMFTAKSQVNDKVIGYEAGVDDYLTKPVHPAELVAHIRALLSRARVRPAIVPEVKTNYSVGIISARGGVGTSTLTLNLAAMLAKNTQKGVIAAELRPSQGTWSVDLGIANANGLDNLLQISPSDIKPKSIEQNLANTTFGVPLLCANSNHKNIDFCNLGDQLISIVNALTALSPVTVLDIGTPLLPKFDEIGALCKKLVILVEPTLNSVNRTHILLEHVLATTGLGGRTVEIVLYNHTPSTMLLSVSKVSEILNDIPINIMIPAVPELMAQANSRHMPLVLMQPDGLFANQINLLAKSIQTQLK